MNVLHRDQASGMYYIQGRIKHYIVDFNSKRGAGLRVSDTVPEKIVCFCLKSSLSDYLCSVNVVYVMLYIVV